jgi:hypothetical protein
VKDDKLIRIYRKGKKKFYREYLITLIILPITTLLGLFILNYLEYKLLLSFEIILYCLLIGYSISIIAYISVVPKRWNKIVTDYENKNDKLV